MKIIRCLLFALIPCMALMGENLLAQSAWLPPSDKSAVSIEAYRLDRPQFSRTPNGSTIFLTAQFRQRSGLALVFELPIARSDDSQLHGGFALATGTVIGNPYIGINYRRIKPSSVTFDVGVRLPSNPDNEFLPRIIGVEADYNRFEAFGTDLWSVRALVGFHRSQPTSRFTRWIKLGGKLLYLRAIEETELIAELQAGVLVRKGQFDLGVTLASQTLVTEEDLTLDERSELQAGFGINVTLGSIRPGLHVRVPVTDNGLIELGNRLNAVVGADMTVLFGGGEKE